MIPNSAGGANTTVKLDLISDPIEWLPLLERYFDDSTALIECPSCRKSALNVTARCGADRIGFALLTCPHCGKSANFSRVKFPEGLDIPQF